MKSDSLIFHVRLLYGLQFFTLTACFLIFAAISWQVRYDARLYSLGNSNTCNKSTAEIAGDISDAKKETSDSKTSDSEPKNGSDRQKRSAYSSPYANEMNQNQGFKNGFEKPKHQIRRERAEYQPGSSRASGRKRQKMKPRWSSNKLRRLNAPQTSKIVRMPIFFNIDEDALINYCISMVDYCDHLSDDSYSKKGLKGEKGEKGEPGPPGQCEANCTATASAASTTESSEQVKKDNYLYEVETERRNRYGQKLPTPAKLTTVGEVGEEDEGLPSTDADKQDGTTNATRAMKRRSRRKRRCRIEISGAKTYADTGIQFGCWMKDRMKNTAGDEKYWITYQLSGKILHQYENRKALSDTAESKTFYLPEEFQGTNHIVYNNHFYYYSHGSIVNFDLESESSIAKTLPYIHQDVFLYTETQTTVELAADKYGIWLIHAANSEKIGVTLLDSENLARIDSWKLPSVKLGDFENVFVTCGTLFGVKNTYMNTVKITYAYDLHCRRPVRDVEHLAWQLNSKGTGSMIYDDVTKRLYTYDGGKLVAIRAPVKCKCGKKNCSRRLKRLKKFGRAGAAFYK